MRVALTMIALLMAGPAAASDMQPVSKLKGWVGPKPEKPPCECRHKTGKAVLGEKICLQRGERMVTMECSLVLNNTTWREVGEGCDVAMN